jgi:hypothetical protein
LEIRFENILDNIVLLLKQSYCDVLTTLVLLKISYNVVFFLVKNTGMSQTANQEKLNRSRPIENELARSGPIEDKLYSFISLNGRGAQNKYKNLIKEALINSLLPFSSITFKPNNLLPGEPFLD